MRKRLRRLLWPFIILAVAGCSDDPTAPESNGAATFSRMLGSSTDEFLVSAAVNSAGLRLVAGNFSNSLHITGSSDTLVAVDLDDVYLAAFTPDGSVAWKRRYGGDGNEAPIAITRDGDDNIYIAGFYRYDTNFGGTDLFEYGVDDVLVAKVDANGDPVWALGGGSVSFDVARDIVMADDGGVFVCGKGEGQFVLGGAALGEADQYGFLLKLSALGGSAWSELAGGTSNAECFAVARAADGSVWVTGSYLGGNLEMAGAMLPVIGGADGFVAHFTDAGDGAGAFWITGSGEVSPRGLVVIGDQPVVVGSLGGTVDFDVYGDSEYTSLGLYDAFVVRYNWIGNPVWARTFGGSDSDFGIDVCRIGSSDVLVCGTFENTITLDSFTLSTNGVQDVFAARLDADGNVVWAGKIGSAGVDYSAGIAAAGESAIVLGIAAGDVRFPDGTVRSTFGGYDGFVYQR
jgi:hypothetical protein